MMVIFDSNNGIQDRFQVEGLRVRAARLDGCRCRCRRK